MILHIFHQKKVFLLLTGIICIISSLLALLLPIQHDYSIYVPIWQSFLKTHHPYLFADGTFNGNAYGPLFILFAFPYALYPTIPRLLFVMMWLTVGLFCMVQAEKVHITIHKYRVLWLALLLNSFFYIICMIYGMNEIVMVSCIVFGLYMYQRNKDVLAGFLFGLGFLFKFIPLLLVPFLFFGRDKLRWRFSFSFAATAGIGMFVSYILWHDEILVPFKFGLGRSSTFLSLFNFLNSSFSPLRLFTTLPNVDFLSFPLLLLALLIVFLLHLRYKYDPFALGFIVLTTAYTFLKTNHPQYHMSSMILLLLWLIYHHKKIPWRSPLALSLLIYFGWISGLTFLYIFMNGFTGEWQWIRDFSGLPTFIITGTAVVLMARQRSTV